MAEQRDAPWDVLTDYAVRNWAHSSAPTREQFRHAFDWVLLRITGGPPTGSNVVMYNGDAVVQSHVVGAGALEIRYDVYHPKHVISVLEFIPY